MNAERGVIRNRNRKQQIVDFSGVRYGNITPTDIDMLIDYRNQVFVFGELKLRDTPIERGQELAFERLVDLVVAAGRQGWFFVAEHEIDDASVDVPADQCTVRKFYTKQAWHTPKRRVTLLEACDWAVGYIRPASKVESPVEAPEPIARVSAPTDDEIFGKAG